MDKPTFRGKRLNKPEPMGRAFRNQTPQEQGRRKEKALAKEIGGYAQPGSGCFPGKGGDVKRMDYLIEHKFTKALAFALSIKTLRKIKSEAQEQNRKPAVVIDMSGGMMYEPEKWALIPYEDFQRLLEE